MNDRGQTGYQYLAELAQWYAPMELIGDLKHGIWIVGPQDDPLLAMPWSKKERKYLKAIRNTFAHGDLVVLVDGSLRVFNKMGKPNSQGKPNKEITSWEWTLHEFSSIVEKVRNLLFNRIQAYMESEIECTTCGATEVADKFLTCGHVEYEESDFSQPALVRKPAGASLKLSYTIGVNAMKNAKESHRQLTLTRQGLRYILNQTSNLDKEIEKSQIHHRRRCGQV